MRAATRLVCPSRFETPRAAAKLAQAAYTCLRCSQAWADGIALRARLLSVRVKDLALCILAKRTHVAGRQQGRRGKRAAAVDRRTPCYFSCSLQAKLCCTRRPCD